MRGMMAAGGNPPRFIPEPKPRPAVPVPQIPAPRRPKTQQTVSHECTCRGECQRR